MGITTTATSNSSYSLRSSLSLPQQKRTVPVPNLAKETDGHRDVSKLHYIARPVVAELAFEPRTAGSTQQHCPTPLEVGHIHTPAWDAQDLGEARHVQGTTVKSQERKGLRRTRKRLCTHEGGGSWATSQQSGTAAWKR